MKMRIRFTVHSCILVLCFLTLGVQAQERSCCPFETDRSPSWSSNIVLPFPEGDPSCEWQADLHGKLVYPSADRIIVSFHFDCFAQNGLVKHTVDRLIVIDAHTGESLKSANWSDISFGNSDENVLVATNDRTVLLAVGAVVKLCSVDLEELHSRHYPIGNANETWHIDVSPSGKIALLHPHPATELHWIDTSNLQDVQVEQGPKNAGPIAISDNEMYYHPRGQQPGLNSSAPNSSASRSSFPIYVKQRGQQTSQPLCDSCVGVADQVMPNGWLFLSTGLRTFWLVDRSGKVMYKGAAPNRKDGMVGTGWLAFARETDRMAFLGGYAGTGFLETYGHDDVTVFDMARLKNIFVMNIKPRPLVDRYSTSWPGPAIALSPNGSQLAVLYGSRLKSFSVDKVR